MKNYALRLITAKSSNVEERFFVDKEDALKEYAELREDKSGSGVL